MLGPNNTELVINRYPSNLFYLLNMNVHGITIAQRLEIETILQILSSPISVAILHYLMVRDPCWESVSLIVTRIFTCLSIYQSKNKQTNSVTLF